MGTRNLTFVQVDGIYKVAQYGQFDGYPDGLGLDLLGFLKDCDFQKLKERANALKSIDTVGEDDYKAHPTLGRDYSGAKFLFELMKGNVSVCFLDMDFIADSLMCEWAYVIDLDRGTFEVFAGFNTHTPLTDKDRFFAWVGKSRRAHDGTVYHPCYLKAKWPLDKLPDTTEFLAKATKERGELDDIVELVQEASR